MGGSVTTTNLRGTGHHLPWHTQAAESTRRLVPQERTRVADLPTRHSYKAASSVVSSSPALRAQRLVSVRRQHSDPMGPHLRMACQSDKPHRVPANLRTGCS